MNSIDTSTYPCFHCGEPCPDPSIVAEDQHFCCTGCKTVYEVLQQNGMGNYYTLAPQPGTSRRQQPQHTGRFAYLDDADIQAQLLDFKDSHSARIGLQLPQIHCASCVWLLENLNRLDQGILHGQVDFLRREIDLHFEPDQTSLRQIVELLASLGYEPTISLSGARDKAPDPQQRALLQKLALAGFCFGNTMLFSLPEYLAAPGRLAAHWGALFDGLKVLLALPVLFYCSTDYFFAAFQSLRQRTITIDVPIALGLVALFGRSLYEILTETGGGYMDSFTGLVFFLLIGKLVQRKTFAALSFDRDYRSYFPLAATAVDNGQERSIPVAALKPGMCIRVRHSELIPADSRLNSAQCQVDYSYVTGESEPVAKHRGDLLYAGGRMAGAGADLSVLKETSHSYLTRLWNNPAFAKGTASELSLLVNQFSKYFTAAVLLLAGLTALYWLPRDPGLAANAFTAVLIIACPCALALATPFTLGTALNALAAGGLYLKEPAAIERLARFDAVVFDKTGTLTCSDRASVEFTGAPLSAAEQGLLAAALQHSTHPLCRKLRRALTSKALSPPDSYQEQPGRGIRCLVAGQHLVIGSSQWLLENNIEPDPPTPAPAGTAVYVAIDKQLKGYYTIDSTYRPHLDKLFARLRPLAQLFLLSGDNDRQRQHLAPLFGNSDRLHFFQTPTDKLDFVKNLAEQGHKVLMVGDGLNDAGALKQSAAGIAVSEKTSGFIPACDGILAAERLVALPAFLRFARGCLLVVGCSFALSIGYNIVGLSFAVRGALSPLLSAILMPLSSITIIAFTTLATRALAHFMELET